MDDLISRQAATDALERGKDKTAKGDIGVFCNAIIQNDIDKIKGLPSVQSEQLWTNWIPVDIKNDSPEENEAVLLGVRFKDDFKYFVTSRQDYNYWTGLGREIKGELRWLPLPSPYQKEGEK